MTTKVIMPQMGESIFEGTITKWLKKVGDRVARDEPLFEISTDKVDSEIPAPAEGVLSEIIVPEGKTIQINSVVAIIDGGVNETGSATPVEPEKQESVEAHGEAPSVIPPIEPHEGELIVAASEASTAVEVAPVAQPTQRVADQGRSSAPLTSVKPQDIRTSPLVRRLARENDIDLSQVQGTGLEGRVTKDDVLNYIASSSQQSQAAASRPAAALAQSAVSPMRPVEEARPAQMSAQHQSPSVAEPAVGPITGTPGMSRFLGEMETLAMTPMRKAIAEHMVISRRTSAHVSTVFEVDMTSIVHLREQHKTEFEKREGVPLTYTPFFVKVLVDAVREFPILNSSVSGDSIILKKPIHVGIAVALPTGLLVPVVKDAQLKSLTGLAVAIHDLAERARTKRLKPDEVQNGTISITNPGSYGALFGTPIINQPQVAILGVGGIEKRPVVVNDAIAIRSMVFLSLSFDHRVIDGVTADQFMAKLKEQLQGWTRWSE